MKLSAILAICALLLALASFSQIVNIPDPAFKSALVSNLSLNTNADSEIQVSEAAAYSGTISAADMGISSLQGLEVFGQVTVLHVFGNMIETVDLSANTGLIELLIHENALTSLDVTACSLLQVLDFSFNQMTSIDVSQNSQLTNLGCIDNQLSELDLTQNGLLTGLNAHGNLFQSIYLGANPLLSFLAVNGCNLTDLNLDANPQITYLNCVDNQIAYLNLEGLLALETANVGGNPLTSLFVGNHPQLTVLVANNCSVSALDLSGCPNLEILYVSDMLLQVLNMQNVNLTGLSEFNATGNPLLTCVNVDDQQYMEDTWMAAVEPGVVFEFFCSCTVPIPDPQFKAALVANPSINVNANDEIECEEAIYITEMYLSNMGITDLSGLEHFTALQILEVELNDISNLNMPYLPQLIRLFCNFNSMQTIDVTQLPGLENFDCHSNFIQDLNTTGNPNLKLLNCGANQLSTLNVLSNPLLNNLDCSGCNINTLDLSSNVLLDTLAAWGNNLVNVDLTPNTNLIYLSIGQNPLAQINLTACADLWELHAGGVEMTDINLTQNNALNFLNLGSPNMTTVDLTQNTSLTAMILSSPIAQVNFSGQTNLGNLGLWVADTSPDLSPLVNLFYLDCAQSFIQEIDLSNSPLLQSLYAWNCQLTDANISNGSNASLTALDLTGNNNLYCIQVDDDTFMDANFSAAKDPQAVYAEDCMCVDVAIDEVYTCGDYTWIDGQTYAEDTYGPFVHLLNEAGCDSIAVLDFALSPAMTVGSLQVNVTSAAADVSDMLLQLYPVTGVPGIYPEIELSTDEGGQAQYTEVPFGNYVLRANPDYANPEQQNFLLTYSNEVYSWANAEIIGLGCDQEAVSSVEMIELALPGVFLGSAGGTVYYWGFPMATKPESRSFMEGDPIPGIPIILRLDTIPFSIAVTGSNGEYLFENLPEGNYDLVVDIPGLGMAETHLFEVGQELNFENLNFYVDEESAIYITDETGVWEMADSMKFSLFPNPSSGEFLLGVPDHMQVDQLTIHNVEGRKVLQTSGMEPIDLSTLPTGLYVFILMTSGGVVQLLGLKY